MNLAERLYEEIRRDDKRIIIVGDSMTDVWVHGQLAECQDYCQKFIEKAHYRTPGGASNAARCLTYWTSRCVLYSHHCQFQPIKTRFVNADGKIVFRHDDEVRLLPIIDYDYVRRDALHHAKYEGCAAVLLSDYDKRLLTPSFLKEIVAACKARGIPCVVDAKRDPSLYKGAILKCNESYYLKHSESIRRSFQYWIVTKGEVSPYVHHIIGQIPYLPLGTVKCVNHVGAGDCFAAMLVLALAHGFSLVDASEVAHSAGRVYVQHPHNRPPRPEEVIEDMKSASIPPPHSAAPSHADVPAPA